MGEATYQVTFHGPARRAIAERLPEAVAAAVLEFCSSALAESPHRVGKPLFGPLSGCHAARRATYRIVYRIAEDARTVHVLDVAHRRDAYRPKYTLRTATPSASSSTAARLLRNEPPRSMPLISADSRRLPGLIRARVDS